MKEKTSRTYIKEFSQPIKLLKLRYIGLMIYFFYTGISWTIEPIILKFLTDIIVSGNASLLKTFVFFYFFYIIFNYCLGRILRNYSNNLEMDTKKNYIYPKVMKKFIILDNNEVEIKGTGKLIPIIKQGIGNRAGLLIYISSHGLRVLIGLITGIAILYYLIPQYFYIAFILLIIYGISSYYTNKYGLKWRKYVRDYNNLQTTQGVKMIMSKFEILQNNKIDKELEVLQDYTEQEKQYTKKVVFWITIMFMVPNFSISLMYLITGLVVGIGIINGIFSLGIFVGLASLFRTMRFYVDSIINFYRDFSKQVIHIEKLFDTLQEIPEIEGYHEGKKFKYKSGNIEIKNISFSYGDNKIFNNFSMNIKGGKKTAIVGKSGSGKTTLIRLISAFLRPQEGNIIIDGQKLENTSLKSYYKNIGYLTQEPSVFDGTIYDNLTYGLDKKINQKNLENAIKMAECDFIYEFKDGIETEIGEKGIKLSGGQRQRLAIAKIFIKNPKILFLDEPTSSLDSFSEEKITAALNKLFEGRTVVVIAHRLQTVKEADEIFVMEDSKIIEKGKHNYLVKKGGIYAKMLGLQGGIIVNGN